MENVIFRGKLYSGVTGDGRYYFGNNNAGVWDERGAFPYLNWNTFGVPHDQVADDIAWQVSDIRGPGEFGVDQFERQRTIFDTAQGISEVHIWSQSKTDQAEWYVTEPGRYCIDLRWSADTRDHGPASVTRTITVVADGEGFTHDDTTLTQTCEDGAEPTPPGDPGDPDPDPETPVWDVPNWTETETGAKILNLGHVDVASLVEDSVLDAKIKDTTVEGVQNATEHGAYWHEPEDVVFQLFPDSQARVPAGPQYEFMGPEGTPIWQVSEVQDHSLLWPGWSTEHIPADVLDGGVGWTLTDAEGPGDFFLYTSGAEFNTTDVHFNTADGVNDHDTFTIAPNAHVHGNWAFTAQGIHCLAFERTATLPGGEPVGDEFTLAVAVGDTDPTVVDPANCDSTDTDPDPEYDPEAMVTPSELTESELADPGVMVTGVGFPAEVDVTLTVAGTEVETGTADGDGNVEFAYTSDALGVDMHEVLLSCPPVSCRPRRRSRSPRTGPRRTRARSPAPPRPRRISTRPWRAVFRPPRGLRRANRSP